MPIRNRGSGPEQPRIRARIHVPSDELRLFFKKSRIKSSLSVPERRSRWGTLFCPRFSENIDARMDDCSSPVPALWGDG